MSTQNIAPAPYADAPIKPGLAVYTLDNKRLGRVKDLEGKFFKVDARFRRDFWLSSAQVAYVDERTVGMLFRTDEAELYRLPTPNEDDIQRRLEKKAGLTSEGGNDPAWRRHFPLS